MINISRVFIEHVIEAHTHIPKDIISRDHHLTVLDSHMCKIKNYP